MKLCVKRVFCPNCQRLVSCKEETSKGVVKVLCTRCEKLVWTHDELKWKYARKSE